MVLHNETLHLLTHPNVQVLEVDEEDTELEVRVARNRLLLRVHPDNPTTGPGGHAATVRVNEVSKRGGSRGECVG
jgi:hypothetical protein